MVKEAKEIAFRIPAGGANGMKLTVQGKGDAAKNGGINGDLLGQIEEVPDNELQRDGNDLIYTLFLSIPDAALGAPVEIPTVEAKLRIKIEPGTQSGKVLRLRGKGVPDINGYGAGDLLVYVQVWTPTNLSSEEKQLLEKLKQSPNFTPKPTGDDRNFFDRIKRMFS